jgi:type I restriction enzyme S subunit
MNKFLNPYENYMDSKSQWLGLVPSHWEIKSLRTIIRARNERNRTDLPLLSVAREKGVFVRSLTDPSENHNVIPEDLSNYKVARAGSLVINKMKAWQGSMGIAPVDGIVSPAYYVYDFAITDRAFGQALLRSKPYVAHFAQASDGVRVGQWDLSISGMRNIPVLMPPASEQLAIVRFLSWANARLERAIRSKSKVISLLNEQRQAIIHRAVTRGLDPNVPLKASGVAWLGDIPAHWEVRQLRNIGRLFKGVGGSKEDATLEGMPCIRYGELYFHYKNFIRQPRGFVSADAARSYTAIRFGDVLFAASGERIEEIGKSAVNLFEEPAVCGGDIVILRPAAKVHPTYLGYALDSHGAAYQKATMCRGTTIKHIYPDELRGLYFCLPPVPEQQQIARKLDDELSRSNLAVSHLEREIELLIEFRARLVADVVTGKLDAREAAAKIPDDVPLDANSGEDFSDDKNTPDEEATE